MTPNAQQRIEYDCAAQATAATRNKKIPVFVIKILRVFAVWRRNSTHDGGTSTFKIDGKTRPDLKIGSGDLKPRFSHRRDFQIDHSGGGTGIPIESFYGAYGLTEECGKNKKRRPVSLRAAALAKTWTDAACRIDYQEDGDIRPDLPAITGPCGLTLPTGEVVTGLSTSNFTVNALAGANSVEVVVDPTNWVNEIDVATLTSTSSVPEPGSLAVVSLVAAAIVLVKRRVDHSDVA